MKKLIAIALFACIQQGNAQTNNVSVKPLAKVKEYGLGFNSLNSYSLQYRWGNEKRLFRVSGNIGGNSYSRKLSGSQSAVFDSLHSISITNNDKESSPINIGGVLNFSVLKIKPVNEKFGFMYGVMSGLSFTYFKSELTGTGTMINNNYYAQNGTFPNNTETKTVTKIVQPFIGLVLGVVYKINPSFLMYAEVAPNLSYAFSKNRTSIKSETDRTYLFDNTSSTNVFGLSGFSNSGAMLTLVYRITKDASK